MKAVIFDGRLGMATDFPEPILLPGWAKIKVSKAGICRTDLEILKGYKGFSGIPGHEFVGTVVECENTDWHGKRVGAGINVACGACRSCRSGLRRHCENRRIMGILNLNGCLAEYCTLPIENLVEIPTEIPDRTAVILEPLSAACNILEQIRFNGNERAVVVGDGPVGILCAWVLSTRLAEVVLIGRHPDKLMRAEWRHVAPRLEASSNRGDFDVAVDATGRKSGIEAALSLCRPRGTVVMKTTIAAPHALDLSPIVVNELRIVGSRCGLITDGLAVLNRHPEMPLENLVSAEYDLTNALEAFEAAASTHTLKVLVHVHAGMEAS